MNVTIDDLKSVRQQLYDSFSSGADSLMNLIDSLCSRQYAQSAVELSLEPAFERKYTSLFKAIDCFLPASEDDFATRQQKAIERFSIFVPFLPKPKKHPFTLTAADATPDTRPYAKTLADRGVIHVPNPAPGNKPIGVGHQYSQLALLPEREDYDAPWVVPMSMSRIPTYQTANQIAAMQMRSMLDAKSLPFGDTLTVNVADSSYSKIGYLEPLKHYANHVEINRCANNRKFFYPPTEEQCEHNGHPTWYGDVFRLQDESTWREPDAREELPWQTRKGRQLSVVLQRWNHLLMTGKKDATMHDNPFDIIRCQVLGEDGKPVFKKVLWLLVTGKRRNEVSLKDAYEAYRQRFDIEHFFRFGKHRLLLNTYQTPDVRHEQNWWELACIAQQLLWLASPLAKNLPRDWERYAPMPKLRKVPSPTQVQRCFPLLIRQFGTPAHSPKPRGISLGRAKGWTPGTRAVHPVVFKGKKNNTEPVLADS
jgi:hypothetical protein